MNAAEAVNFVPADWVRFGAASMLRYRSFRKPSVLCHQELVLQVARDESELTSYWVAKELRRAAREELQLRCNLWAQVCALTPVVCALIPMTIALRFVCVTHRHTCL
jgi:hypothetical protein